MASRRRKFTPQFKARVVLEVLTGAKRPVQACRAYGISESVLSRWRKTFLERAPQVFTWGEAHNHYEERIAELERLVGRLTMELEIAKKPRCFWTHHGRETETGDEAEGGGLSSDEPVRSAGAIPQQLLSPAG